MGAVHGERVVLAGVGALADAVHPAALLVYYLALIGSVRTDHLSQSYFRGRFGRVLHHGRLLGMDGRAAAATK